MNKESWGMRLAKKLAFELANYQKKMLEKDVESIYRSAYEIDKHIAIFERLLEMTESMSEVDCMSLLDVNNVIDSAYIDWLKTDDSTEEELKISIENSIEKLLEVGRRKHCEVYEGVN